MLTRRVFASLRAAAAGAQRRAYGTVQRGGMGRWGTAAAVGTGAVAFTLFSSPLLLDAPPRQSHPDASAGAPPPEEGKGLKLVSADEVKKHNSRESCWVVVGGEVWDVTDFLDHHPGGSRIILTHAGSDVTSLFTPIHPPHTLENNLSPSQHVGTLDPSTASSLSPHGAGPSEAELVESRRRALPPLGAMINLDDFDRAAEGVLGPQSQAWAYYRSAADDESAYSRNRAAFSHLLLLPRTLVPVSKVDASTCFLGQKTSLPIFIAPAALAKLGHPDGEVNLTRGARRTGIVQGVSSNASCSLEEMFEAAKGEEGQARLWFQLYVNRDRKKSEAVVKKALAGGCSAILLTVDAPVGGKRERDLRVKGDYFDASLGESESVSGAQFSYLDADLQWSDLAWLKSLAPNTPIIIKGIATPQDAQKAYEHGCAGVILSNHGGRQLDSAPAPLATLLKIRRVAPELVDNPKFEIYLDGGVRRGTDVVKALCAGARGVALGRPFLYSQSCYGSDGVVRVFQIMKEEIELAMRLVGARTVDELRPEMVELLEGGKLLGRGI